MLETGEHVQIPFEEDEEDEEGADGEKGEEEDEEMEGGEEEEDEEDEVLEIGDGDRIATPASLFPPGFGERVKLSPKRQLEIMATQSYMDDIKRVFNPSDSKIQMFMTPEKVVSYGIYEYEDVKMGIIRLDSFMPQLEDTKSIEIIRGLLVKQLKDTDCLVFDVRGKIILCL